MRVASYLWIAAGIVYALLYIPLAVVILFSFNDSELNAQWLGFSFRWYRVLLEDKDMLSAAFNSLMIAIFSSFTSTVLGTMAGLASFKYKPLMLPMLATAPIAMPEILLGISMLMFFRQVLDLTLGFWSILIAHVCFSLGAVAIIIHSRLGTIDISIFEASRDLGADQWKTLFYITLPLIRSSMAAGFLITFTLSIDDFVVTFFNAGIGVKTLPLQIYSMIKVAVTPEVNAVSTVLMSVTLTLIVVAMRCMPRSERKVFGKSDAYIKVMR